MRGTIKFYIPEKSHGYIATDKGDFCFRKEACQFPISPHHKRELVTFEVVACGDKRVATSVVLRPSLPEITVFRNVHIATEEVMRTVKRFVWLKEGGRRWKMCYEEEDYDIFFLMLTQEQNACPARIFKEEYPVYCDWYSRGVNFLEPTPERCSDCRGTYQALKLFLDGQKDYNLTYEPSFLEDCPKPLVESYCGPFYIKRHHDKIGIFSHSFHRIFKNYL